MSMLFELKLFPEILVSLEDVEDARLLALSLAALKTAPIHSINSCIRKELPRNILIKEFDHEFKLSMYVFKYLCILKL